MSVSVSGLDPREFDLTDLRRAWYPQPIKRGPCWNNLFVGTLRPSKLCTQVQVGYLQDLMYTLQHWSQEEARSDDDNNVLVDVLNLVSKGFLQSEVLGEVSVLEGGSSGRSFSRSLRRSFPRSFQACSDQQKLQRKLQP